MLRNLVLVGAALVLLGGPVFSYHSANVFTAPPAPSSYTCNTATLQCTDVQATFYVPLSTAVWWDHQQVAGVPTGLKEATHMIEIDTTHPVMVTAETFPRNTPDTPKVCGIPATPTVFPPVAGTVIVHGMTCVKDNGYSVQIHYFPWIISDKDPDHVLSPTESAPLATTTWRVDAIPLSYREATIPAGHWQIWIDPAVSGSEYDVTWHAFSSSPFYFDYLGHRGCPFYFDLTGDGSITDNRLLGCPAQGPDGYV